MNKTTLLSLVLVLALACQSLQAQQKVALLAAVTTYSDARMNAKPLQYPEADATAIAEVLKASDYKATLLVGKAATQAAVQRELQQIQKLGDKEESCCWASLVTGCSMASRRSFVLMMRHFAR